MFSSLRWYMAGMLDTKMVPMLPELMAADCTILRAGSRDAPPCLRDLSGVLLLA